MAHDYVKDQLSVESQTGRVSLEILATLLGGTLLICSVAADWIYGAGPSEFEANFPATLLAFVAALLLGAPLVWVSLKELAEGHMHMNELVALAVLAAFAIGQYTEAAAIAFFMIISVLIENRTALGAQASIESLVRITPTRAHRLSGGQESEVDAKDLKPGDIVRVRPGDNIPADGKVAKGSSTVNQANITGESIPADKNEGDEVFGGTINLTGVMEIEVLKAGTDTTLGRVKDLILQAERTRIPILRMIDRYAGWYTPTVLMVIAIVLFFTIRMGTEGDPWQRAIAMLVVACPCAVILATPTAMVAALSAAARLGVLVKSVVDLEGARNLTAMVFDKTGTLTTGQLQVTRLTPAAGVDGADLLRTCASAEQHSKHPVAKAVTDVARKAKLALREPTEFEEISGRGVRAVIEGRQVFIGRAKWLTDGGAVKVDAASAEAITTAQAAPESDGVSLLFIVRDGALMGWVGLEDNTRAQAASAIDDLRTLGLKRLIIVTGDRESVAKRVAAQMHTDYKAEVLPHQKLEMVDELKAKGHRVAVVGDGVNDAPALAAGDISIAMGAAGSDVAIHSASIALMNNNLNRIPFLIRLSKATSSVVKQNLVIGGVFITVFMGLSAAGYVSPVMAAILHVVSGLVVIFNSARLVRSGEEIEMAEAEAADAAARSARGVTAAAPAVSPKVVTA
ncbi:MAG: cation-translocating P-type ATPase [Planctomycetota bacterium]|nr:cation-translocating P-type ATPase [Planctomycetota bacterium]